MINQEALEYVRNWVLENAESLQESTLETISEVKTDDTKLGGVLTDIQHLPEYYEDELPGMWDIASATIIKLGDKLVKINVEHNWKLKQYEIKTCEFVKQIVEYKPVYRYESEINSKTE